MTDIHLVDIVPRGLEYVFVPPGLPLIAKAVETLATTSILVRGGAGTGKTTFATGLAHAISREHGGVALYLTTEFVATELAYKAASLDLPEGCVKSWDAQGEHAPGTILAQHLLRTHAGSARTRVSTVVERKRAAIDAVWEIIENEGQDENEGEPRVRPRVVVIDAFGLPEVEQRDGGLRNELLELVQSLELMGISSIIVEEAGKTGEAWLPFVVDVVFEIELWPDPETGDLIRRLKCPKSRYVQCLPGPHDYGLTPEGVPVVRPDPMFASGAFPRRREGGPVMVVPFGDEVLLCPPGTVMTSAIDEPMETSPLLVHTPGVLAAHLRLGPVQQLVGLGVSLSLSEADGLFAPAWELLTNPRFEAVNTVVVRGAEYFLTRPRARIRLLRALTFLGQAGFIVCLCGRSEDLRALHSIAHLIQANERRGLFGGAEPLPRLLGAERWLLVFAEQVEALSTHERGLEVCRRMLECRTQSEIESLLESLNEELSQLLPGGDGQFERACFYNLIGVSSGAALYHMSKNVDPASIPPTSDTFRYLAFIGDYWSIASIYIYNTRADDFPSWWRDLTTLFTGSAAATSEIEDHAVRASAERVITLLRALSEVENGEACSRLISTCAQRFELPDWYQARLRAELVGPDGPEKEAAIETLAKDDSVPLVHRAELLHNLGVHRAHRGDHDGAREAYAATKTLNPLLELPE